MSEPVDGNLLLSGPPYTSSTFIEYRSKRSRFAIKNCPLDWRDGKYCTWEHTNKELPLLNSEEKEEVTAGSLAALAGPVDVAVEEAPIESKSGSAARCCLFSTQMSWQLLKIRWIVERTSSRRGLHVIGVFDRSYK